MNRDEELCVITMEEASEVIFECSKLMRFGNANFDVEMLEKEIGDLMCMFNLMEERGWISWERVHKRSDKKAEKLKTWSKLFDEC